MSSQFLHLLAPRHSRYRLFVRFVLVVTVFGASNGCQTVAPLHVWTPPDITSAVGKKVAIAPLAGPQPIADQIEARLFQSVPRDQGRAVEAIAAEKLPSQQPIRLASVEHRMPSALALLPIVRQQGVDYLLMGEVLADRSPRAAQTVEAERSPEGREAGEQASGIGAAESSDASPLANAFQERVSVAWRIYDVAEARPLADRLTVTEPPALPGNPGDQPRSGEAAAPFSGDEIWRLLSPSVQRNHVFLAVPWLLPGSKAVRRGNDLAAQGRWPEAERLWRQTLDQHPYQHAARNNLALAAAARQDFSMAKGWIHEAIGQRSKALYQTNFAWIETRQRDYHAAFGLADPPEGWFITTTSPQTP